MVQVLLHNSTLTPAPAAYGAAVEKALAVAGATLGADGEVGLAGEAVLVVTIDPDDDIAVIDLERFDDAVLDLVFDLAEATASFVVMGSGAVCGTPATGQPPPAWSMRLAQALAKARAERAAKPAQPLFKRLTDALFGKSI
jgi:hypothetical protein